MKFRDLDIDGTADGMGLDFLFFWSIPVMAFHKHLNLYLKPLHPHSSPNLVTPDYGCRSYSPHKREEIQDDQWTRTVLCFFTPLGLCLLMRIMRHSHEM